MKKILASILAALMVSSVSGYVVFATEPSDDIPSKQPQIINENGENEEEKNEEEKNEEEKNPPLFPFENDENPGTIRPNCTDSSEGDCD